MKFGVVVFPGSNCDTDCYHVIGDVLGQDVEYIWHEETSIDSFDCIVLPGGFSYGDYLRTGAIARFSPVMEAVRDFAEKGGLVLGICNGFQILCEAEILPGTLRKNNCLTFVCDTVNLRVENADTPFTSLYRSGEVIRLPIAHGEGNYYIEPAELADLEQNGQIVFRYCDDRGNITGASNPNGSVGNIAGICNARGNVLGLMPHPERRSEEVLGGEDGRRMFESAVRWLARNTTKSPAPVTGKAAPVAGEPDPIPGEPDPVRIEEDRLYRPMGLRDSEYRRIVEILGRRPTWTEIGMYAVLWSEHCAYKHSKPLLKRFPVEGPRVLVGPGENAGVIDIGEDTAIAFRCESHNRPCAIEPYQGAATGVGGILRDILAMGSRPIALLNSLRFGEPDDERVRYLIRGVVGGISGYGNCVGIPTVGGEVYFEDVYRANPLCNVMCVGTLQKDRLVRGYASGVGNSVMLVGARTGRDGIHGATFASDELNETSESRRPSVQIGDPFSEKLLIEACLQLLDTEGVVGIQDMGAAGITSSCAETASRAGTGIEIDLDRVPLREEGMTPYEIMLSESQERMLVIVRKSYEDRVAEVCRKWGLNASVIGRVTSDGMLRVLWSGKVAAAVPAKSLTDGAPVYTPPSAVPAYLEKTRSFEIESLPGDVDLNAALMKLIASPDIASKEWVYKQYDYQVRTDTVLVPGGADAAVLRLKGTNKGIALCMDGNGRYTYLDPRVGGAIAVAEAARNVVCTGAEPVAITNCLNFGNPEKPEVYWQLEQAIDGMSEACRALGVAVTGGNASLYNENSGKPVYPTPVVGMVGLLDDVSNHLRSGFKQAGDLIVLLGENRGQLGGSEYLKVIHWVVAGEPPAIDLELERKVQQLCLSAHRKGLLNSAHDCSDGGLAVALAECCMNSAGPGEVLGAEVELDSKLRPDGLLFGECQSRIVVSVSPGALNDLIALADEAGVPVSVLGTVGGKELWIRVRDGGNLRAEIKAGVDQLMHGWKNAIAGVMS